MVKMNMVAAEEDLAQTCLQLEQAELDAPDGTSTPDVYLPLLTIYLVQNDLVNAKFLWKRIPEHIKSTSPELKAVWDVGQLLWKRDFANIYGALKAEWPTSINHYMNSLEEKLRARAFQLVNQAYSIIQIDEFVRLLGTTEQEALQLASSSNWQIDLDSRLIHPKRPELPKEEVSASSEQQLALLTDYVSYLEN